MKNAGRRGLLVLAALLCFAPSVLVAKPHDDKRCGDDRKKCQPVPDNGSGLVYLLGAGVTCAGAMVIRSRENKLNRA